MCDFQNFRYSQWILLTCQTRKIYDISPSGVSPVTCLPPYYITLLFGRVVHTAVRINFKELMIPNYYIYPRALVPLATPLKIHRNGNYRFYAHQAAPTASKIQNSKL